MTRGIGDLKVFLAADGSQIEVRELAEISGDPLLIKQFRSGADIHCQVGSMLTGWPEERIAKEKDVRKAVKNLHFGIIFGKARGGVYDYIVMKIRQIEGRAAAEIFMRKVSRRQVERMHDKYFRVYGGVRRYVDNFRKAAEEQHRVETLFGFVRHIRKDDETRHSYWGNQAINSPIQGTAHGFLLICLALLDLKPRTYDLLQECIMEVHDALFFKVRLRDLPAAHGQLIHLFEKGSCEYAEEHFRLELRVPLVAEASAGFCMGSMIEYGGEPVSEFLPKWQAKQREIQMRRWEDLAPQV